jgi:hypothetical protein
VRRYFFHLYDDVVAMDEEGVELSGPAAARERAVAEARQIACAEVLKGHLDLGHRIDVADEAGETIFTVHFGDTIEVKT